MATREQIEDLAALKRELVPPSARRPNYAERKAAERAAVEQRLDASFKRMQAERGLPAPERLARAQQRVEWARADVAAPVPAFASRSERALRQRKLRGAEIDVMAIEQEIAGKPDPDAIAAARDEADAEFSGHPRGHYAPYTPYTPEYLATMAAGRMPSIRPHESTAAKNLATAMKNAPRPPEDDDYVWRNGLRLSEFRGHSSAAREYPLSMIEPEAV